ncbi:MAG: hypothetical protein COU29_04280 [Candidatus Magasanikbacteria bacterium CG10_big_fil_rev_8_21_14_0_10_36_32]|uniref:Uncharacterized protein n=1 Tax=Candidatus Magasanikbacteria bacterium CG10_big_fil_rev_8_21_14_0_10_36_32 TaxID=1974646 RepID=A0A2M6W5B5_9BACT|nr:MAG: hypothetical protein COU29_04280 [Candidatus Magasanikbacteria bacterium CG10_big_fil_rev_8_21_14_0_10_36_32]
MQFLNNLNLKPTNILKIAGLVLVSAVVITLAFRLIGSSLKTQTQKISIGNAMYQTAPSYDAGGMAYEKSANMTYGQDSITIGLSSRNAVSVSTPITHSESTTGDNAEEFEVTEYNANIETRHLQDTCGQIASLKSRADVIFENANEYERSCNYGFKVKRENVDEILAIIEALNPKELNENTYTIKRLVDDYTSEVDILNKKIKSIEETLTSAVKAHDNVTALAAQTQNVESLAKIIDSKINIIERLTQERININAQLERLDRAKADQLDRLNYTYFNVYAAEDKFVDIRNLKDSWKEAIKSFVRDINKVLQDITINLIALMFIVLQYIIYFFIVLIVVKYGWKLIRYIWKK